MAKAIIREFSTEKTILKFFDYKGAPCVVDETLGTTDDDGNIVVKAGTPYPSNDGECLGYILNDVDVTNGSDAATYVYAGSIDGTKITANGITVSDEARAATPRVTFFE